MVMVMKLALLELPKAMSTQTEPQRDQERNKEVVGEWQGLAIHNMNALATTDASEGVGATGSFRGKRRNQPGMVVYAL